MQLSFSDVVGRLGLMPHPEGGYYREIRPGEEDTFPWHLDRPSREVGLVYFLLDGRDFFPFHHQGFEETWHLYWGGPLEFHLLNRQGEHRMLPLAHDQGAGHGSRLRVYPNTHRAMRLAPAAEWALAVCVRPPNHSFASIEPATRGELLLTYPGHEPIIRQLSREV
jgi:predicted cupin superfamily sugar epimerase